MRSSRHASSVTSLPQSPQDEAKARVRHYAITMGIRTVCFVLMVLVQPMGWWTWAFAAAAIFLPYIAVIDANAGADNTPSVVESPTEQLAASEPAPTDAPAAPGVITIHENRQGSTDDEGA